MTAVTCETYDITFNSTAIHDAIESYVNNNDKIEIVQKGSSNSAILVVYRNG